MGDLTLYADSAWVSPWVFHAMVALEEKNLQFRLETVPLPIPAESRAKLANRAVLWKVPILVDGDLWFTESMAISEYLSECYPAPKHAPLLPADAKQRARARQIMLWLRTDLLALREERPSSSIFGRPKNVAMSDKGHADAEELIRVADKLIAPEKTQMFDQWCIADCDLALAVMRLVANGDAVPARLVDFAIAQWGRPSVRKYLSYLPTTR